MDEESLKHFYYITSRDLQQMFDKKPFYFARPRLVGLYDIDHDKFSSAKKVRHRFKEPKLSDYPLDLSEPFEPDSILKHATQCNLMRPLLHAISNGTAPPSYDDKNLQRTAVYTRRGILESIMEFRYGKHDFDALISRFDGNIYMIKQVPTKDEFDHRQICSHHMRLSQLLLVDTAGGSLEHGHTTTINDNVFQVSVHQTILGKYNVFYVGRIQGIIADEKSQNIDNIHDLDKMNFVSLKQMWCTLKNNNVKLLKYWLQAYLSNVSHLYLAYKDKDGVVREPIERLKLLDIPKNCFWKPGICTTFLNEFLERVEHLMSNVNSLDTVFKFHFNGKDKTILYKKYVGKTEMSFIPHEFFEVN